jgi:serine/threonine protein kinase
MAFKLPLPKAKARPDISTYHEDSYMLPSFQKSDFSNATIIGMGSFGRVLRVNKGDQSYVIKEQRADATDSEHKLFLKEARLLDSLTDCDNIVKFHGFSAADCAMLMEYCCFSFKVLNIDQDDVFDLKGLLATGDQCYDYEGFEHLQLHIAVDILSGLSHLHGRNIAHRDLKPHNVLITNVHYCADKDLDKIQLVWSTNPVIAKLSDFGESRATLVQTQSLLQSRTQNLNRGSPAYMVPEALTGTCLSANVTDLKAMDIWSTGMIFYHLLNPSIRHPFSEEVDNTSQIPVLDQLKMLLSRHQLPHMVNKYKNMQVTHIFN